MKTTVKHYRRSSRNKTLGDMKLWVFECWGGGTPKGEYLEPFG